MVNGSAWRVLPPGGFPDRISAPGSVQAGFQVDRHDRSGQLTRMGSDRENRDILPGESRAQEPAADSGGALGKIDLKSFQELMKNRDFKLLWFAQIQTAIGDWIIVAALFAMVDQLSGGRSYGITAVMAAKFMPAILLGFLAGVLIDRFDRKKTLMISDVARAGLYIMLPFAPNLLTVCVLVFVIEAFTVVYGPARDASVPDLVDREHLVQANSLNQLTLYASMAFGTAIAGTIISLFTWLGHVDPTFFGRFVDPHVAVFVIDAGTCLISAYLIYLIAGFKKHPPEKREKMSTALVMGDLKEGFSYLWGTRFTRTVIVLILTCFLGGGTMYVLVVGFVKYVLGSGDATFMYILTALLAGMMIGSVLAGFFREGLMKDTMLSRAISLFGVAVILFSLVTALWLSFILVIGGGLLLGYAVVGMMSMLHKHLEESFRGRAFATIQMIMRTSIFISILVAGPMADMINELGRRLGTGPVSFMFFRLGGSFEGRVDGTLVDFRYLVNGPQLVLLLGGLAILAAGLYGTRSFKQYDREITPG